MTKSYTELSKLKTFEERFEYLKLDGAVGVDTFGFDRYLNQMIYTSTQWKRLRNRLIIRDESCDLGISDRELFGRVVVHHINPITVEDVKQNDKKIYDPDNLICMSHNTHMAIHYGNTNKLDKPAIERSPNDTCPWR